MATSPTANLEQRPAIDMPVLARSQPDFLATVARLRGLQPADVATARVLELGSRLGRNLIPLAERYPQATFLGIDSSEARVAEATQVARQVGLANIEFRRRDLDALGLGGDQFDYLIAEGFYSSIDDTARDCLFEACRGLLAPQGVGYVSYKTYPGHHVPDMLGEVLRFEAQGVPDSVERVARGRAMVKFLRESVGDDSPYSQLLRAELAPLTEQDDGTLVRGFLVVGTRPVYFREFLAQLARHGLQFLGDGAVSVRHTDDLGMVTEERLTRESDDPLVREQYRDVLRNRRIRQSLVCHAGVELDARLTARRFEGLYLEGRVLPQDPAMTIRSTRLDRFVATNGAVATTSAPVIKAALVHLAEIWPEFITLDDLVAASCRRVEELGVPIERPQDVDRLTDNLLQSCGDGLLAVHAAPPSFTSRVSARPVASLWARWQALRGETPTNRRHQAVHLEGIDAHALTVLDGSRDTEALLAALVEATISGRMSVFEGGEAVTDPKLARPLLAAALIESLARLAQQALLIG